MTESKIDYERDVQIDPTELDVEWLRQADLGRLYGTHAAKMRRLAAAAAEKVKVVRAELIQQIQDDPVGTTGKKTPNALDYESYYRTHKRHKEAKQEWLEAEEEATYAEHARWEISNTRKETLRELCGLFKASYFAGPTMPRDLETEWKKKQQEEEEVLNQMPNPTRRRRT